MNYEKLDSIVMSMRDELIADLQSWIAIPSVLAPASAPNAPFGPENRRMLDLALETARKYGFEARDIDGYAGDITLLIGVSTDGKVTGMQVRDMSETLGLGGEALTDWKFLVQFLNTSGEAEVGTNVDALTGATVTSKAIARSVNSAVGFVTGADVESSATSWGG